MHRLQTISIIAALILMIVATACGGASAPAPAIATPVATQAPIAEPASTEEAIADTGGEEVIVDTGSESLWEEFDPSTFSNPTLIDNPWFPMHPGMQYVYEGVTEEGGESIPHRVIITITDLTKVINGVRAVVSWDQDFSNDKLVETELAFFAQDNYGNVWRLGEYPEVYDEYGKLGEVPAWIAGLKGARAGIIMTAEPQLEDPSYSQGWAPAVDFTDRGQADQMGQQTCVPFDCFEDVLVIAESSRSEPDAFQLKYYARDIGNVRVGWRGADASREELELVDLLKLSPVTMEEVHAAVLELEKRAYKISKEVYDQTPPLEGW